MTRAPINRAPTNRSLIDRALINSVSFHRALSLGILLTETLLIEALLIKALSIGPKTKMMLATQTSDSSAYNRGANVGAAFTTDGTADPGAVDWRASLRTRARGIIVSFKCEGSKYLVTRGMGAYAHTSFFSSWGADAPRTSRSGGRAGRGPISWCFLYSLYLFNL